MSCVGGGGGGGGGGGVVDWIVMQICCSCLIALSLTAV